MFPYYFSWLIFMLMCIYFHSEVIIKKVSENFVLVLFLGWNTCNWNMITSILCILDLSWTAKADLMAPVCSGGFQWFFYYYYLLFKLRFIMITIADFWEGTVREQFQVVKINTLWSSLCLHSCVASCACWSYTDLSFQGLHMLGRSQEASGVFLETSGCFFWRCRKAVFSFRKSDRGGFNCGNTTMNLNWYFLVGRTFPRSKKEILGERVFLLRTSRYACKYHHSTSKAGWKRWELPKLKGPKFCVSSWFFWSVGLISCFTTHATPSLSTASEAGGWIVDWPLTLFTSSFFLSRGDT